MNKTQPNVLLICVDQWPGALLGCAGHPAIKTPTLDQIAANGILFENAYSECPVCIPARRTLMTGLSPHAHGALENKNLPMPDVPTLAQSFRNAGYQAVAVGKLHVSPQRQRIGFDDVVLDEEGRGAEGARADDYELFLGDNGFPGMRFAGGMCNNEYLWRPWHLKERLHVTHWSAQQMCRQIVRRDPLRPGFWFLSFSHPHPPMEPLPAYLDLYRDTEIPDPVVGTWIQGETESLPTALQRERQGMQNANRVFTPPEIRGIRRAYYAMCTHIDHQLRLVIGTLRQEGLLQNTILCFTADHGDMLGDHNLWAKQTFYEGSARIPMILSGTDEQRLSGQVGHHRVDSRVVGVADIMPTLLNLAGIDVPAHCEGHSMLASTRRPFLFGANGPCIDAHTRNPRRMIRDENFKLIYYPAGNLCQLFDMRNDRCERQSLADCPEYTDTLDRLCQTLADNLPEDERHAWTQNGRLTGWPDAPPSPLTSNSAFSGQRGLQWPSL